MSRLIFSFAAVLLLCACGHTRAQEVVAENISDTLSVPMEKTVNPQVQALIDSYSCIIGFENNKLVFADSTTLEYDDGREKTQDEALEGADVEDMFREPYQKIDFPTNDAGRIRSDALIRKLYGKTYDQVRKNIVNVPWCPKNVGQILKFTSLYGAADSLAIVSRELDARPELAKYLKNASTLNWRVIAGTDRLSAHSFGMAIDICVDYSNYWRWSKSLEYVNRIPMKIVEIFERHGFIWGGRWKHYDTMHFEFRPELL